MKMYEVTYSATLDDFRRVLGIIDRTFPSIPEAPAPTWLRYLFLTEKWFFDKVPIWTSLIFIVVIGVNNIPLRFWHILVVAATSCAAGANFFWSLQDKTAMRCIKGHVERRGSPIIRLTNDGVEAQLGATHSFTPWKAYSRVEIVDTHLFLFYDCATNYIPLTAFSSENEMSEFAKFAASKIIENQIPQ